LRKKHGNPIPETSSYVQKSIPRTTLEPTHDHAMMIKNTGWESTTIPTPTTPWERRNNFWVHNKHIQHKQTLCSICNVVPANHHLLHHFRYSKEPLFFLSKQWLTSNYLLQSPVWKHEGNKPFKKKHLKYITNTFKAFPLFFPPCKEKKHLRPQSWR
jgi:hypothetical protein